MFRKGAARRQAGGPLISAVAELSHAGSLFGTRRDFILARPDVGTKAWRKLRRRFTPVRVGKRPFPTAGDVSAARKLTSVSGGGRELRRLIARTTYARPRAF